MKKLVNKVTLITGASNGIGKATAERFAKEGAKVIIADHNIERAEKLASSLKDNQFHAEAVMFEATEIKSATKAIDKAIEIFGGIDCIVNNVGVIVKEPGKLGSKQHNKRDYNSRHTERHRERYVRSHFRALHIPCAEALPYERGNTERNRLHRQENKLVYLGIGCPATGAEFTEMNDVGLDKHIGEGGDGHLQGGRNAHREDLLQHIPMDLQLVKMNLDAVI